MNGLTALAPYTTYTFVSTILWSSGSSAVGRMPGHFNSRTTYVTTLLLASVDEDSEPSTRNYSVTLHLHLTCSNSWCPSSIDA